MGARLAALAFALTALGCGAGSSSTSQPADAGGDALMNEAATDAAPPCSATDASTMQTFAPDPSAEIHVGGDTGSVFGVSDPSLCWPPSSAAGFMSYTSLGTAGLFTRIAKTIDGTSFTYVVAANEVSQVTVATTDTSVCGAATCSGIVVHETSSLVYDGADPDASRRFKLFDYSYVIVPGATPPAQHAWGYIGLYTAPNAQGPWSKGEKALGWSSTAPGVSATGAGTLLSGIGALSDCLAFTEPAAIAPSGGAEIYLALGCVSAVGDTAVPRVVLLRSVDHAATFTYVGLLLSATDGMKVGGAIPGVQPSDFYEQGGTTYLIVSTLGTTPTVANAPVGYTSCTTVAVSALSSATVQRGSSGSPVVVRKLSAPDGGFAGACSYKPQFSAGYLLDEVVAAPAPNLVLATGIACP